MSKTTKARKGDLILVEETTRNYYSVATYAEAKAAGQTLPESETTYQFGVVASATKEGEVKAWSQLAWGDELINASSSRPIGHSRRWVMSAKTIDVAGVLTAAKSHHYPGHPGQPKPFSSFDEAKRLAQPFLTVAVRA